MPPSSVTAWRGPSAFDGSPVRVVLVGLVSNSDNAKTGPMVQSYILPADEHPVIARRTGGDAGVCGDCRGRPTSEGWCYVSSLPLLGVARRELPAAPPNYTVKKPLRIGAYGDPAAAPYELWRRLRANTSVWTGYTHAWRTCNPRFKLITMASVDDREQAAEAEWRGWRWFRTKPPGSPLLPREILCLTQSKGKTCVECGLCSGTAGRGAFHIAIDAHGPAWSKFLQPRLM